jgi:TPR repeat protein
VIRLRACLALLLTGAPAALAQQPAGPGCATPAECLTLGRDTFNGRGVARDPARSWQMFVWACERNEFAACTWAGFQLQNGHGVSRDPAGASRYFERACTGNGSAADAEGCAYLGDQLRRGAGVPSDPARAFRLNTRACEARVNWGCVQLGHQFLAGTGTPTDSAAAFRHFDQACRANDPAGCRELAWSYRHGRGAARDDERATALFKQNCDLRSDASSCVTIGYAYQQGLGVDSNAVTAVRYYAKACEAGEGAGCGNLAWMYANAAGTARDSTRAIAGYERGCQLEDSRSCTDLGWILERGASGIARNLERAAQLYERGCSLGNNVGCRNFGLSLQNGEGTARDPARAIGFLERACSGGLGLGCNSLGAAHKDGVGVPLDLAEARRYFETGCRLSEPYSCTNLARMLRGGEGGDADPVRSFTLLQQNCAEQRLPFACDELGYSYQYGHGTRISDRQAIAFYREGCRGGWSSACARLRELSPADTVTAGIAASTGRDTRSGEGNTGQASGDSRAREGRIWLLSIGISAYRADSSRIRPLRFADADATAFYQHLTGPNGPGIDAGRRFLLQNQQATATAIREHLTGAIGLGGTLEQDTVIIFLAGHGTPDPENPRAPPFFLAWDSDPDRLASTALPMNDLESAIASRLRAGYILVIMDACHGGGISRAGPQANQAVNASVRGLAAVDRFRSIIAVSSASENETAAESPAYGGGHGLFTWKLLEGLQGEADRNADGGVTLDELLSHLQRAVPSVRAEQHPNYQASPNASLSFRLMRRTGR